MGRIALFEFQDLDAFPQSWGHAGTAYLRALEEAVGAPALLRPLVARALAESGQDQIVDLCSGGGGPIAEIVAQLAAAGQPVSLTLSDREPDAAALAHAAASAGETARVWPEPVDASSVPAGLEGLRTIFNAFHHFDDALALAVMRDAASAGQPLLVVELSERAAATVLSAPLIPLLVWLIMPRVRPVRADWLVLTYLLPILPLTIAWDGLVSHLRTRSVAELGVLAAQAEAPGWAWTMGRAPLQGPAAATWMLGRPVSQK